MAFAARAEGSPPAATSTATWRLTSSAASVGNRPYSPRAQRNSITTFLPSIRPPSPKPLWKAAHESDYRHCRLLRARRERPRRRRAAEKRDELAPFHSITSSALAIRVSGTVTPSVLAVFRFTTSSNFTARSMGKFAGGVPFRILSTKDAER